jgi:hypothetical protein
MNRKRRASGFEMRAQQNGRFTVRRRNTLRFSALQLAAYLANPAKEDKFAPPGIYTCRTYRYIEKSSSAFHKRALCDFVL